MIAFLPIDIETADLQSSIAIDYDSAEYGANWQGEWSAGSYDEGDVVYKGVELYESLEGSNTDDPEVGSVAETPTWLALGKVTFYPIAPANAGVFYSFCYATKPINQYPIPGTIALSTA